jgi:hypothetical protein
MRACAEAVFRRTLACHGHPPVFGRRPGPNVRKRKTAVEFSRMHIRSAQPVTVADGWKERRGVSIRKQRVGGLPPSECDAPAGRANRTAWPAHAGGAARREGRRREDMGVATRARMRGAVMKKGKAARRARVKARSARTRTGAARCGAPARGRRRRLTAAARETPKSADYYLDGAAWRASIGGRACEPNRPRATPQAWRGPSAGGGVRGGSPVP